MTTWMSNYSISLSLPLSLSTHHIINRYCGGPLKQPINNVVKYVLKWDSRGEINSFLLRGRPEVSTGQVFQPLYLLLQHNACFSPTYKSASLANNIHAQPI